jgi:aryl-alcohol dehydrogenase-like predicted oxidoreductase
MDYRPLGRTGVQVSQLCLGTMMFGAWGNTDHDDSIRIIHARLDAGINFVDTADVYSAGESEEIVGKALKAAATTSSWPRSSSCRWATTRTAAAGRGAGSCRRSRTRCRRLGTDWIDLYQVTARPRHRRRGDARRAHRPRPAGQGPLHRLLVVLRLGRSSRRSGSARERRLERFRTEQPPYSLLVRGIELDVLPTAQRHGMGILTYSPLSGGLALGQLERRQLAHLPRPPTLVARFDMSLPENQRKLEASSSSQPSPTTRACRLIELAIAFIVNHPAVTSAIIGHARWSSSTASSPPPTSPVDATVLDRIDEIVRPGRQPQPRRHQLRRTGPPTGPAATLDQWAILGSNQ